MELENQEQFVRLPLEETQFIHDIYIKSGEIRSIEPPYQIQADGTAFIFDAFSAFKVRDRLIRTGEMSQRLADSFRQPHCFNTEPPRSYPTNETLNSLHNGTKYLEDKISEARNISQELTKFFDLADHVFLENDKFA